MLKKNKNQMQQKLRGSIISFSKHKKIINNKIAELRKYIISVHGDKR